MNKINYDYVKIEQLREQEYTWEQIGNELGVSKDAVRSAYNRFKNKSKATILVTSCLNCGKSLNSDRKFCSHVCQNEYQYKQYIERWKKGEEDGMKGNYQLSTHIRRYMLEKSKFKCSKCGWGERNIHTNTIPLEIDHIDGDYTNNKEENLQVLCPNCHSLTPTYKGANKGNGRKDRSKYNL